MSEFSRQQRHKARRLVLQAVYQWQMSGGSAAAIIEQYQQHQDMSKVDEAYFIQLLKGVMANSNDLDNLFTPFLDRELATLEAIELALLRIGSYELQHQLDIPYRVVIDEAMRLGKAYGSEDGYKYVNAILDKVARQVRANEMTE